MAVLCFLSADRRVCGSPLMIRAQRRLKRARCISVSVQSLPKSPLLASKLCPYPYNTPHTHSLVPKLYVSSPSSIPATDE